MNKKKYMGHELTENGRAPRKKHVKYARKSARNKLKKANSSAELRNAERLSGVGAGSWHRFQTDKMGGWYGFFRKRVGKNWDDVFSELINRIKKEGDMHLYHAKLHASITVDTDVVIVDGKPKNPRYYYDITGFYVDPRNNKLCFIEYESWKKSNRDYNKSRRESRIFVDGRLKYNLKNGVWYVYGEGGAHMNGSVFNRETKEYVATRETVRPMKKEELDKFYDDYPTALIA